jgi:hypothetical protein
MAELWPGSPGRWMRNLDNRVKLQKIQGGMHIEDVKDWEREV